jgi:hypothetical protein
MKKALDFFFPPYPKQMKCQKTLDNRVFKKHSFD